MAISDIYREGYQEPPPIAKRPPDRAGAWV